MKAWSIQRMFGSVGEAVARGFGQEARDGRTAAGGYALRLGLGFLLAHASILGGLSPFGVAFAAAQTASGHMLFAALGAALGYLTLGLDVGLRYIAVCILTLSAGMVFKGARFASHYIFMPLTALILSTATGAIYLMGQDASSSGYGMESVSLVLLITELLLTLACAFMFKTALMPRPEAGSLKGADSIKAGGYLALSACALLALSGFLVGGSLSPARIAAVCAVLLCAYRGGAGVGAVVGLSMGLVMDLGLGVPFYSMSYGFAGLLAGVFRRAGKLWAAMAFVCSGAVTALWALDGSHRLSVLLEAFIASVVFMLLSDNAFPRLNTVLKVRRGETTLHTERLRDFAVSRLSGAAQAFEGVGAALAVAFEHAADQDCDGIDGVFDRTTKEVCKRCARVEQCWDAELPATCASIRDAAKRCEGRGRLDKNDLPGYFAARCLHFKKFISVGNQELSGMLYRRQFRVRTRQGRELLCRQYGEFARILSHTADELEGAPLYDSEAEQRLSRWLESRQLTPQVSVYATANGRMCAELAGENLSILLTDKRELTRDVSRVLGWMVNQPEEVGVASLDRLTLWESEPVLATLGIAAHKRSGQPVSGDSGTYFKTDDGKLYIILADGMGSGREAAKDSRQAVKLLEGFLRAGVSAENALEAVNSSLLLIGDRDATFVTLDLLVVDLLGSKMTSYKYGAAPTFIRRAGQVSRIAGTALPCGLEGTQAPDTFSQQLAAEQWVVMVSDGIADADDDSWLSGFVDGLTDEDAPRDAAARILQLAMRRGGASDDMTVLALKTRLRRTRR